MPQAADQESEVPVYEGQRGRREPGRASWDAVNDFLGPAMPCDSPADLLGTPLAGIWNGAVLVPPNVKGSADDEGLGCAVAAWNNVMGPAAAIEVAGAPPALNGPAGASGCCAPLNGAAAFAVFSVPAAAKGIDEGPSANEREESLEVGPLAPALRVTGAG